MFPTNGELNARAERVREAQQQLLRAQNHWRNALAACATTPRGLAIGFALGFGIGCLLKPASQALARKSVTLPTLLSMLLAR